SLRTNEKSLVASSFGFPELTEPMISRKSPGPMLAELPATLKTKLWSIGGPCLANTDVARRIRSNGGNRHEREPCEVPDLDGGLVGCDRGWPNHPIARFGLKVHVEAGYPFNGGHTERGCGVRRVHCDCVYVVETWH